MDAAQLRSMLDSYLAGTVATQLPQTVKQVGVRVWLPPVLRQYDDQFALNRVAEVPPAPGQAEIERENLQRMVALTARLQGRSLGTAVVDVKSLLGRSGTLPPGIRYELGGLYAQQQIAFAGLVPHVVDFAVT